MSGYVIEGTWEEIKRREAELIGRYLRVTVKPPKRGATKEAAADQKATPPSKKKVLLGLGAAKDILPSSEEYMREKRAEIELEEWNC